MTGEASGLQWIAKACACLRSSPHRVSGAVAKSAAGTTTHGQALFPAAVFWPKRGNASRQRREGQKSGVWMEGPEMNEEATTAGRGGKLR